MCNGVANGQYMFSCGQVEDLDFGEYELSVPLNGNCEITLYGFSSGRAPFKEIVRHEEESDFDIIMEDALPGSTEMNVTYLMAASTLKSGWVAISGRVTTEGGTPLCAMVLANGQHMFSCDPVGEYALDVPLNAEGEIKLFVFASGQVPFERILKPDV